MLKKVIILLVLLAFFYLVYKLVRQRQLILAVETFQEGAIFTVPSKDNELSSLKADSSSPAGISNSNKLDLPLIQYCIKGSYNSAFTGNYINKDMIKYLLSRGVRFFDFEIYPNDEAKDASGLIPVVSCKDSPPQTTETFANILKVIGNDGFQGVSPNPKDPIFLHLRIYPNNNNYLYTAIASTIENSNINSRLYRDGNKKAIQIVINSSDSTNTGGQKLSDIMGKVIIILDFSVSQDYKSTQYACANLSQPPAKCNNFDNYVNMLSGGSNPKYTYSNVLQQKNTPPVVNDNGDTASLQYFKMVCPDTCNNFLGMASSPPYFKLPLNYGIQVVMYPFYLNDINLGAYEEVFANSNGTAFVPMTSMLSYIKTNIYHMN